MHKATRNIQRQVGLCFSAAAEDGPGPTQDALLFRSSRTAAPPTATTVVRMWVTQKLLQFLYGTGVAGMMISDRFICSLSARCGVGLYRTSTRIRGLIQLWGEKRIQQSRITVPGAAQETAAAGHHQMVWWRRRHGGVYGTSDGCCRSVCWCPEGSQAEQDVLHQQLCGLLERNNTDLIITEFY